ncbi:MAG TPA: RidA family protein [Candidatus Elarobacter sp.]|jgi:2-iminobutanoate/2-iminopropanoate deaminase|nr:RidA family protein [Candidatus Elarobacter sp.]
MADDRIKGLPFSESVRAGDTVYVAGQIGLDRATMKPPVDVRDEARLVLNALRDVLGRQGLTMDDLTMVTVHAPDVDRDYAPFNEVYVTYFNGPYPARAFLGSGPLLFGARFEVTAIADARRAAR